MEEVSVARSALPTKDDCDGREVVFATSSMFERSDEEEALASDLRYVNGDDMTSASFLTCDKCKLELLADKIGVSEPKPVVPRNLGLYKCVDGDFATGGNKMIQSS